MFQEMALCLLMKTNFAAADCPKWISSTASAAVCSNTATPLEAGQKAVDGAFPDCELTPIADWSDKGKGLSVVRIFQGKDGTKMSVFVLDGSLILAPYTR